MLRVSPMLRVAALLWFLVSMAGGRGLAQATTDLSGVLRDPQHATVANAELTVTQQGTGLTQQAQSNRAGGYFFSLQPGTYVLDIHAPGFRPIHREDVVLQVGQPARLDFTLTVGGPDETIDVNAGMDELQQSFSVGATITEAEIARLPVNGTNLSGNNGRNYTSLILLAPGTSDISLAGGDGTISGTNLYSVNGQRNQDNHYTLDGIDNNFFHKQSPGLSPPMDSMKEFRVATNNTADFGRSAGANVALVTKSGTRDLHGSVYEYARQAIFDANDWFNNHNGIARQPYLYNQYGVNVGGPLVIPHVYHGRSNTFWFFSYEGFRRRQSKSILSNVPTAAERQGDFSAIKSAIYDPLTGVANSSGTTRTAFPGNIIPQSRLDPVALAYLNDLVPLPNVTSPVGNANYINNTPARNVHNIYVGRLDYKLGSRNSFFFRILQQDADQSTPQSYPQLTENTSFNGINYALGWDAIPDSRSVLQLRFGFNNPHGPDVTRNNLGITRSSFFQQTGIRIFSAAAPYDVLPSINATDFTLSETAGTSVDDVYEANATYSRSLGDALLKAGVIFQPRHYYHDATSPTSGTATFSVMQTNSNGLASNTTTGSGTASFLLGFPSTIDRGQGSADVDAVQTYYGAFAVYNRKFGRLTVEGGLRYEFYLPAYDKQDRLGTLWVHPDAISHSIEGTLLWAGVNPLPDPVTGATNEGPNRAGFGRGLQQTRYENFMPRIGLAYFLGRRSVVRAGYGFYDNTTAFQEVQDERKFYPYNFDQTLQVNNGTVPDTTLRSTGPSYSNTAALAGYAQDPGKKTPYSQQYNLTVETELPGRVIAQLAYVGSVNKHQIGYEPFNTAPLPDSNPADVATLSQRRLLPQFGDVYQGANRYKSNYNALQALSRRRFRQGFEYQANYTYGRSLDNQSSLGEIKTQDPFNPGPDYSRSSFDLTHIFNASASYDLPFGRGRRFGTRWPRALDQFLGGWSIQSINRYETGPPVNVTLGGLDVANTGYAGSTAQRPNVTGDPNAGPRSIAKWFNTSAFTSPAFGTYGNSHAFIVNSGPLRRTDASIYKRFVLFEHQSFDLRADFFNLPNTPSFGSPKVNFQSAGSFGTITKVAVNARQIQVSGRLTF